MYLTSDKVVNAVLCANRLLERPEIFGGNRAKIPISVEAIQDFVAAASGYQITKEIVTYKEGKYIRGRLHRYKDKTAKIHVRSDQDDYWKRLVATKEMLHLIVDDDGDYSPYGDEILDSLVLEGHVGILSATGSPTQSEVIAEIAAMEVLYPLQLRGEDIDLLIAGKLTLGKVSLKYEIPEPIVSTQLNRRYMEVIHDACAEMRVKLDAQAEKLKLNK